MKHRKKKHPTRKSRNLAYIREKNGIRKGGWVFTQSKISMEMEKDENAFRNEILDCAENGCIRVEREVHRRFKLKLKYTIRSWDLGYLMNDFQNNLYTILFRLKPELA